MEMTRDHSSAPDGERPWLPISSAPFDRDLVLAYKDGAAFYALVFPCRRAQFGWIDATTGNQIDVHPSHWRPWA